MLRLSQRGISLLEQRSEPCSIISLCITALPHSEKGANFETKVIKKLCKIAGIQKTRTSPYHPMGNFMVERFNYTLLNMLWTMSEKQKRDWKAHVPSLTYAYNAAVHESTGFSPFYLIFWHHPRLAIDVILGIRTSEESKSHQDYVDKL